MSEESQESRGLIDVNALPEPVFSPLLTRVSRVLKRRWAFSAAGRARPTEATRRATRRERASTVSDPSRSCGARVRCSCEACGAVGFFSLARG